MGRIDDEAPSGSKSGGPRWVMCAKTMHGSGPSAKTAVPVAAAPTAAPLLRLILILILHVLHLPLLRVLVPVLLDHGPVGAPLAGTLMCKAWAAASRSTIAR